MYSLCLILPLKRAEIGERPATPLTSLRGYKTLKVRGPSNYRRDGVVQLVDRLFNLFQKCRPVCGKLRGFSFRLSDELSDEAMQAIHQSPGAWAALSVDKTLDAHEASIHRLAHREGFCPTCWRVRIRRLQLEQGDLEILSQASDGQQGHRVMKPASAKLQCQRVRANL